MGSEIMLRKMGNACFNGCGEIKPRKGGGGCEQLVTDIHENVYGETQKPKTWGW